MEKISIVIPIYNTADYLEKCVSSILQQSYSNIELLLIDDGSTDGLASICDRLKLKDDRVKVFHQKNAGVSAARNLGIKKATGKYLAFCDSDDWVEEDMYEYLVELLERYQKDISSCQAVLEFPEKCKKNQNSKKKRIYSSMQAVVELHKGKYIQHWLWNKLFKRELFNDVSFQEDIAIGEDYIVLCSLLEKSNGIVCGALRKYHYVQRKNSVCNSGFYYEQMKSVDVFRVYAEKYSAIYPKYKKEFYAHYILEVMAVTTAMIKGNSVKEDVLNTVKDVLKAYMMQYLFTVSVPIYLKASAVLIVYNMPVFSKIYQINRKSIIKG